MFLLSSEVCQLLGYWESLGGGQNIPERSSLDLRQLTAILPWMFILEMGGDGSLRYRLAGSSLEESVGRGMAGRTYCEIFADREQAAVMEELYAIALVQSCGLLRTGALAFQDDKRYEMEVLALPFVEARAMGGIVLVGVVRPFDFDNMGFVDRWGDFRRVLTNKQLSGRVNAALELMAVQIRALDVQALLNIQRKGGVPGMMGLPSVELETLSGQQNQALN